MQYKSDLCSQVAFLQTQNTSTIKCDSIFNLPFHFLLHGVLFSGIPRLVQLVTVLLTTFFTDYLFFCAPARLSEADTVFSLSECVCKQVKNY